MAAHSANITCGAAATLIYRCTSYKGVTLNLTTANNTGDVYVGGSTVTSSGNGLLVQKNTTININLPFGESLYCAGNGTDTVKVLGFV